MSDEVDPVLLAAEQAARRSVLQRAGVFGNIPSSEAEILQDLRGHSPAMCRDALRNLVARGSLVLEAGMYALPPAIQAEMRAARQQR